MILSKLLPCLLLAIELSAAVTNINSTDLHLIVGLPLQQDTGAIYTSASWERGWQILPGAQIAVESINDRPDILPGHKLRTVVVDTGNCGAQNFNLILQFVNHSYHQDVTFIGAVGILCPTELQIIPHITGSSEISAAAAVSKSDLKLMLDAIINGHKNGQFVVEMTTALLKFLRSMKWNQVAAVSDSLNTYFSYFVEKLVGVSKRHSSNITVNVHNYATDIGHSNLSRIVIVSVSEPFVAELLCSAHKEGLAWPKHVWIVHTHHVATILNMNATCDIEAALENVLFFSEKVFMNSSYSIAFPEDQGNVYSAVLHNLVWSTALIVNGSLHDTQRRLIERWIDIIQVKNSTGWLLAEYQRELTFINLTFRASAPSDKLLVHTKGVSPAYTAIFMTEIITGLVLITLMLIGFSCFRNTAEVKSTSFSLSLLVFLGSYLMLVYLSILLYFHQPWPTSEETLNGLCISLNWFSGLGVPNALVLATVLVKLLRIYHIFSQSTPKKLSKKCSDSYLAVYVMLILLPLVVVHTIWTNVDPYLGLLKVTSELDIVEYEKQCASKYTMLWYVVLALYILIIFAMLFGVAIKMRNIKVSHFNDTKKVTVLVVCYFVDLIVALTCWRILYTKVNAYVAAIVLHIGHFTAIVLCQLLLFAPKVFPPLLRHVKGHGKRRLVGY